MPYAFERRKASLLPSADDRIKIFPADRERIITLHNEGWSTRAIAREYAGKCSRRLIQFIISPEKAEHAAELYRLRRLDQRYYDKEKHTKAMRRHRQKKQRLIKALTASIQQL